LKFTWLEQHVMPGWSNTWTDVTRQQTKKKGVFLRQNLRWESKPQ